MDDSLPQHLDRSGLKETGWLVSCVLHGSLAFGAVLFVQRLELAPQAEPFKWNVALVASPSTVTPPTPETSAPPAQTNSASTPASAQTASSARAAESAPEPIHASVETPAPPPPPIVSAAEKPAPTTPSIPPAPIVERVADAVPEPRPQPKAFEPMEPAITQPALVAPPPPPAVPSAHGAQATPVESSGIPPTPSHDSVRSDSVPVEPVRPSPTLDPPSQQAFTAQAEPAPTTHNDSAGVIEDAPSAPPLPVSTGPQVALAPIGQSKPAKPDDGWLGDLMFRWIKELDKRYPAVLRTEGIEGRVTLTALLHDDGKLSDVRVAKSSGNVMLDQAAVEDVRKGPPVTLSRPLERPHMLVKFSISYALKTAR